MKKHTLKKALLLAGMAAIMLGAAAFPPAAKAQEPKLLWEKKDAGGSSQIVFSPDAKYCVATCSYAGDKRSIVKIFHVETGELYKEFMDEGYPTFSPDGQYLVTRRVIIKEELVKVMDTLIVRTFSNLETAWTIGKIAWTIFNISPDNKYISVPMASYGTYIFNFETGALLQIISNDSLPYDVPLAGGRTITNAQFNPKRSSELLISYTDNYKIDYPPFSRTVNHIAVYDLEEKKIIAQSGIGLDVWNISYLDSSHILRLCSYYDERKFQLIDVYTGQVKQELKLNADQFDYRQASTAPFVLTGGGYGFSLWSLNSLETPIYTFPFNAPYKNNLYCLSKNADYMAIGGNAIQVYKSPYSSIPGGKAKDNLLYPNPSSGVITIPLENIPLNELKLIIHDTSGKEVYTSSIKGEKEIILDISSYAKGSYLIMLQGSGFSRTYKFVKE